jgi:hypothetical protein
MLGALKDAGPSFIEKYAGAVVDREIAVAQFDQNWRLARVFAESDLFVDVKGVAQAMTKIQLGESWNMTPADAMQHVYFVKGRPAVQNEYLAAKMRDAGLTWEIEWHRDGQTCTGCTLWPSKLQSDGSWKPITERINGVSAPASISFTKTDAERAGLIKNDTYKVYGEDMYFWRCIARLRRRYATNILSGILMREEAEEAADVRVLPAVSPARATSAATSAVAERIRTVEAETADPVAEPLPWTDRNSLNAIIREQRTRIGEALCAAIFERHGVRPGSMLHDDPKAALVYADMLAAPAADKF